MKQIYKNAIIGPSVNIQLEHVLFPIELDIKKLTNGWNSVRDQEHWKVQKMFMFYENVILVNDV